MMRRAASLLAAAAMTGAALWLFLTPQITAGLRGAWGDARWHLLLGAMLLSAVVQWLRAWRFSVMTHGIATRPDATLVSIAFQLNFYNFVLPFRIGEISYPVLMHRHFGQPLAQATGVLVVARLLDLATVSALLSLLAAWAGASGCTPSTSAAVGIGMALVALLLAWALWMPFHTLSSPRGLAERAGVAALRARGTRVAAAVLSGAIWLAFGALAVLAARAVVEDFSAPAAMLGTAATNLAFALPINGIAGLGPAQAAWVLAVSHAGVGWDEAVITALTVYAVVLSSALLYGGIAVATAGGRRAADPLSSLDKPVA